MKIRLSALVLIVLTTVEVRSATAQTPALVPAPRPLMALARRDLRFGTVLPGISSSVAVSDVRRSGRFEIQGARYGVVGIELLLPPALRSAAGYELLLSFGPGDGAAATDLGRFHGAGFDPRQPLTATLGASGKLYLRLGGTVLPTRDQPGGGYRATVFLTVYNLGSE
jgi:hypothetical protein